MIIILIVAAVISAVTEWFEHGYFHFVFPTDTVIIMVVVVINTILGVVQENKAEKPDDTTEDLIARLVAEGEEKVRMELGEDPTKKAETPRPKKKRRYYYNNNKKK